MTTDDEKTPDEAVPNTDDSGAGLGDLVESSESVDYDKHGFHHKHVAKAENLPAVAESFLARGYILEMVTCQDRRADLGKMRLVYTYNRLQDGPDRHLLHADIDEGVAAPSIMGIYAAADWYEREVYDMYGVRFAGHKNLKRILLPEDADFHALLKDFGRMEDAAEAD